MTWLFLSPEFPPNYHLFAWNLKLLGGVATGIGGPPLHHLPPHVAQSLHHYESVGDLHHTDVVMKAVHALVHAVGPLQGVDSFNEYWLALEARIRDELNLPGPRSADLPAFQQKSMMKTYFQRAGIEPIPGTLAKDFHEIEAFVEKHGFPIIAKPDKGVGSASTYRLSNQDQLQQFRLVFRPGYLIEKFITGTIQTYDGLVDREGKIIFAASMEYSKGVAEVVNEDSDIFYYVQREIPSDLSEIGPKIVQEYGIRARFFHFEFIRSSEGRLYPLEVNMRPPGYPSIDLFNFAHDIDLYKLWAAVILGQPIDPLPPPKYYACYISRKHSIGYSHTHEEVIRRLQPKLLYEAPTNPLFRAAMGDHHYVIRTTDKDEMLELASFAQKRLTL
ncbi:MAG: ATP-grasp domain-containing protein [Bacteroidia bacterium]|nr:ATP-grasp domain-containing protein [Bacteroidia bacterium]MDW8015242.1 ATP-grasp domain-containing protein [Bacteroidia bacterium]